MPIPVSGTCDTSISSRSRATLSIYPEYICRFPIHHLRAMAFRHKRSSPHAPILQQRVRLVHFRPISSEHIIPLFRVISITLSPSRQPYHTRATSSSQAPWRLFPSDVTDVSLFDTFVHFYGPNLTCLCSLGTLPHLQSAHSLLLTFTD